MGSNPSSWERVTCYAGRVVSVDLRAVGASGRLDSFGRLSELTVLRLTQNKFSGDAGCQAPALCCVLAGACCSRGFRRIRSG